MSDDALRELHRVMDARIVQYHRDHGAEDVRGIVTEVAPALRRLSARLDLGDVPTPGIAYPLGMDPLVGDDVLVRRRADGFLLATDILGRAG